MNDLTRDLFNLIGAIKDGGDNTEIYDAIRTIIDASTKIRANARIKDSAVETNMCKECPDGSRDNVKLTTIAYAAFVGDVEAVSLQLPYYGRDVNSFGHNKPSALYIASLKGRSHVVERLLQESYVVPDVKYTYETKSSTTKLMETPLIAAVRGGHTPVVRALLLADADTKRDSNGKTARAIAAEKNHSDYEISQLIMAAQQLRLAEKEVRKDDQDQDQIALMHAFSGAFKFHREFVVDYLRRKYDGVVEKGIEYPGLLALIKWAAVTSKMASQKDDQAYRYFDETIVAKLRCYVVDSDHGLFFDDAGKDTFLARLDGGGQIALPMISNRAASQAAIASGAGGDQRTADSVSAAALIGRGGPGPVLGGGPGQTAARAAEAARLGDELVDDNTTKAPAAAAQQ